MAIFENIKTTFKQGDSLIKLIYINSSIFILLNIINVVLTLFKLPINFVWDYLSIPADLTLLLFHFWTPITYMFLHQDFFHMVFNMLSLFWFGKIFLMYFSEKQIIGLYIFGGLVAALFYVISFNIFPYYAPLIPVSLMLGASGSIMAIIVTTAIQAPNMEMHLMFFGGVKLKFLAMVAVVSSFFGITSSNGGGQLAHLGGALAGYFFIVSLQKGFDITKGISTILDFFANLFQPKKLKVKQNKYNTNSRMSDGDYNANKAQKMAKVDRILDKIKTSGYESLTSDEKKQLFDQGKR